MKEWVLLITALINMTTAILLLVNGWRNGRKKEKGTKRRVGRKG